MFRDTNRNFLKLELCISQGLHTRFMVESPQEAMSPAQSIDEFDSATSQGGRSGHDG